MWKTVMQISSSKKRRGSRQLLMATVMMSVEWMLLYRSKRALRIRLLNTWINRWKKFMSKTDQNSKTLIKLRGSSHQSSNASCSQTAFRRSITRSKSLKVSKATHSLSMAVSSMARYPMARPIWIPQLLLTIKFWVMRNFWRVSRSCSKSTSQPRIDTSSRQTCLASTSQATFCSLRTQSKTFRWTWWWIKRLKS